MNLIQIDGAIGPTTYSYIARGIGESEEQQVQCLIIELDTPGGLLETTKEIVKAILASKVPVVVYVAPQGASAGSAGTFITLAAHIAAMAPATNIGAAHPVTIGGAQQMDTVMSEKIVNYSESYIESIASRRKRNVEWAKKAVRESASITADEALKINVIDLIADNLADLLQKIDGKEVDGKVLHTKTAEIVPLKMTKGEELLRFLFHPEVMFILMLIAIYGIIGEISNPGAIFPGVTGAIALILLLYTVAAMPVNIAGFALIGLAIILFILEVFTPTFGLLTVGGAVAFILGALMLFEDLPSMYQLSLSFLIPFTILTVLFFAFIVSAGIKAQFMKIKSGREMMLGEEAIALTDIGKEGGRVIIEGENWQAISDQNITRGDHCIVTDIHGLKLHVKLTDHKEEKV
ncbi:MAG TPA: nodulation protein NfeD [Balneolales bacterium]|nr:nodulation protein NfeD [Balneolales bacterium]